MLFQERALQDGVHAMIQVLEDNLIANRQPKSRAVLLVMQFLNHPDIKKAISEISKQQFGWGVKQQLIMAAVLGHAQEMVAEHKLKRNKVSLEVIAGHSKSDLPASPPRNAHSHSTSIPLFVFS